jgi:hypothetical protein
MFRLTTARIKRNLQSPIKMSFRDSNKERERYYQELERHDFMKNYPKILEAKRYNDEKKFFIKVGYGIIGLSLLLWPPKNAKSKVIETEKLEADKSMNHKK